MRVIIQPDYQSVSKWAAHYVAAKIKAANPTPEKPFVLGCPTGSSPLGMYKELIDLNKKGLISFQNVVTFNMDEYMMSPTETVSPDDPISFHYRMEHEFYSLVDPELVMPESQRHFPEPGKEAEYDALIEELGGVDLCLGGLGINGHVAFNEAAEADDPITAEEFAQLGTRILPISRETRTINAYGYQRGDLSGMPELCITIGMKQILAAKKIYIALNRPWQNGPLKHVLLDPERPQWPGSLLRRTQLQFCMTEEIAKGVVME